MNFSYKHRSGVSWSCRLAAGLVLALGGGAAYFWTTGQTPEYEASLRLSLAPDGAAATEKLWARSWQSEDLRAAIARAAAQAPTPTKSWWRETPPLPDLDFIRANLQRDETARQWLVTLRYPTDETAGQREILSALAAALNAEWQKVADEEVEKQRADRDRAVAQINAALTAPVDDAHTAQVAVIGQMLAANLHRRGAAPTAGWQNAWRDYPVLQPYLAALGKAWATWQGACVATDQQRGQVAELSQWIAAPQNQTLTQRVTRVERYDDSPELQRLRDRRALVETERMRLLLRATPLHPVAQKLAAEIDDLTAQINALTRSPQEIEEVETRSNPQLIVWQRELTGARAALQEATIAENAAQKNAAAALADLQKADAETVAGLAAKRAAELTAKRDEWQQKIIAAPAAPFAIYDAPTAPRLARPANWWLGGALIVGVSAVIGGLLLTGRRQTELACDDPATPPPQYPVLGMIPKFAV
ncbi:hypothetical protein AGMMS49959_07970 [Planctomycetales bacterium]|nr:hypothetical protein AGMMS49959_07970 [Planctomycetales bacterium]